MNVRVLWLITVYLHFFQNIINYYELLYKLISEAH